jgi:hypothetical protein
MARVPRSTDLRIQRDFAPEIGHCLERLCLEEVSGSSPGRCGQFIYITFVNWCKGGLLASASVIYYSDNCFFKRPPTLYYCDRNNRQ